MRSTFATSRQVSKLPIRYNATFKLDDPALMVSRFQSRGVFNFIFQEVGYASDRLVRRRVGIHYGWVVRIATLSRKNRRHPASPDLLHGCEETDFVIDEHVMFCGVMFLHIVEHLLLVNVDQDTFLYCGPKSGTFHLPRLEYGVAVGKDYNRAHRLQVCDDLESPRQKPISEWIVNQKR